MSKTVNFNPLRTSADDRPESRGRIADMAEPYTLAADELERLRIIHARMKQRAVLESFLALRGRAIQAGACERKMILVSAISEGTGSSFVAQNLAAAFAMDENRTALLIDGNLDSAASYAPLAPTGALGITDVLSKGDTTLGDVIYPIGIPRMRLIPAGQQRNLPIEFFTRPESRVLFQELRERYDDRAVIIDGPPIEHVEAAALMQICDFVLLVAGFGQDTTAAIEAGLKRVGADKTLGVALNDEPARISTSRGR